MNVEQMILNKVEENRDKIISFVQSIVQIPSVSYEEAEVGQAIYQKMKDIGLDEVELVEAEPGRPNVVGRLKGSEEGPTLVFNGHMDVVPTGPEDEWEYPPFSGKIVDGRMHGRGTVDMKSGTCTCILATEVIKELGIPLKGDILLTAVCDEEVGGAKGVRYLLDKGYIKGDLGINCEATNLDTIDVAHKGIFQCDIIFYGRAIHGSRPWLGINAIDKAVDFLNRMKILEEKLKLRKHPVLNYPTINVGTIHGGTVVNMIPSKCVVEINRRIIPGESFEMAKAEIQAILDQLSKEDPDFKAEIKVKDVNMPMLDVPADAPVVEAIRRAHKVVRGTELPIGGKDAGTDAAWIVQATGMPMPIYGPGDYLKYSLGANESIALEDIVDATKVYALAIYYLLGE
jgi:succinyl-diaminopimelate desuccinylase